MHEIGSITKWKSSLGKRCGFSSAYGGAGLQPGFSLGVTKDSPYEAVVRLEEGDVLYFIEEADQWYFDEHDLHVTVDDALGELSYSYEPKKHDAKWRHASFYSNLFTFILVNLFS
ncbi:HesB/YadR/YfhF family protein [Planococcus sp. MB-3u-03]|uniref:HesB/YadR/YfhF family protein n=1 Tax=Planococcus sp. MB-3u-03 TaxID=2058136 RepID=UPI002FCD9273